MKTSNKILFGGLALILFTTICATAVTRSKMKFYTKAECNKLPRSSKVLNLEFSEISIHHSVEAVLKQGAFKVEIDAIESAMPHINHHVENGVLQLNLEELTINDLEPCPFKAIITAPQLDKISIANGSQISNTGIFETSNLEIKAVNGSVVNLSLNVDDLKTSATNSSNVEIAGEVKRLIVSAKNTGQVKLPNAKVNTAKVSLMNSSTALINVDTIASVVVQNSSTLNYIGETFLKNVTNQNSSAINRVSEE